MQKILVKKTVSMTDMRDPKKVLEFAGNDTVAVMNRNKTVGYFTPTEKVVNDTLNYVSDEDAKKISDKTAKKYSKALNYLQDK